MPYIKEDNRRELAPLMAQLLEHVSTFGVTEGSMNFIITRLLRVWVAGIEDVVAEPNYSDFNAAIGVLECVKQEFYRRAVVPYEDKKREQNGDVF